MRRLGFMPLLAAAAAVVPAAAAASVSTDAVTLAPAHGAPGSHFSATFEFGSPSCTVYTVSFWWEDGSSNQPGYLGQQDAAGSGQSCAASIDAVVPAADATPGRTYTVQAWAHPRQVSGPGVAAGTGATNDPNGAASFEVTSPPGGGTQAGAASPSSPAQHPAGTATSAATASSAQPTASPDAGAAAASTGGPEPVQSPSASPDAVYPGHASAGALPPSHPTAARGIGVAVMVGATAALVAIVAGLVWTRRPDWWRVLVRR